MVWGSAEGMTLFLQPTRVGLQSWTDRAYPNEREQCAMSNPPARRPPRHCSRIYGIVLDSEAQAHDGQGPQAEQKPRAKLPDSSV
jgi:hypothetical protein